MAKLPKTVMLLALLSNGVGCVGLDMFAMKTPGPSKGKVHQVVAMWLPNIVTSPDPTRGGSPVKCLGGRVFLFGSDLANPLAADGPITVELYDPNDIDPNTHESRLLAQWNFDCDTLNQNLLSKDAVGWGYSLGCPWSTYRADLSRVEMRVSYQPKNGLPQYSDVAKVTLASPSEQPVFGPVQTRQVSK